MKEVGITIATHGWIGGEMTRGKFMLEDGADQMQWKEEREVSLFSVFLRLENMGKAKKARKMLYQQRYDS